MIGNYILGTLLVLNFEVKLLEQQDLPNQSGLGIFFSEKISKGGMIGVNNDL